MKKVFWLLLLSFTFELLAGQKPVFTIPRISPPPLADFISQQEKTVVPIYTKDPLEKNKLLFKGTGSLLADSTGTRFCILTCDHVAMIKDSSKRFVKYVDKVFTSFNLDNDSSIQIPLSYAYHDSTSDFLILGCVIPSDLKHKIINQYVSFSFLENTKELKTGETIFYSGFPGGLGTGIQNYPISRQGIIAQSNPNSKFLIIDGFVQGGYSGSPVYFLIHRNRAWEVGLIGLVKAYPTYKEDAKTVVNTGFTYVVKADLIIKVLESKFGFR